MLEASERADQLLDEGDMAGAETWQPHPERNRAPAGAPAEGEKCIEGAELTRLPPNKGASWLGNPVCMRRLRRLSG
jgi:hypothetical protein